MGFCQGRRISWVVALVISAGCASKEPASRGTIALIDGKVQSLEEAQVSQVCADHFCEPNYLYSANFGRTRPSPPRNPPPATPPSNSPRPPGQIPPQPLEQLDYSREIMMVPDAWNMSVGADDIVVAIVDTGIDYTHPDLRNNLWRNEREAAGTTGVDDDGNGYVDDIYGWDFVRNRPNGDDDNKHGTHCAGIIGAGYNGFGVIGINHRVKLMPLKFLDFQGSGDTTAAIRAIDYAVANGARVISNSWGGGGYSQLLNDAIQRAIARGVYVVAAAGNEKNDNDARPTYPANYAGVISVGSTDASDELSFFSNYGSKTVFIAAPGSNIFSTTPGGNYESLSGTSMAAPQVSGAIALGLSVKRQLSRELFLQVLCDSAEKRLLDRSSCGRMNVSRFVRGLASL
ncbi:MAG: hypothetical protein RJB38_59 [Pseudomonadota bacterium]